MRIAVMILAHKNADQLRKLVDVLKKDFEIFLHVDKRFPIPDTITEEDHVHISRKRYAAYWGSYNAQLAILALMQMAYDRNCDYYMLISGQDLPLLPTKTIKESIGTDTPDYIYHFPLPRRDWQQGGGMDRITLFWETKYDSGNAILSSVMLPVKGIFYFLRLAQKKLNLKRSVDFQVYCGSLWMNLRRDAIEYILSFAAENECYVTRFKYTRCADEIFFHSILLGFDYKNKNQVINDDLRYIDWKTGPQYPRTLTHSDYERCMQSGKYFGRKFDENIDSLVIDEILNSVS